MDTTNEGENPQGEGTPKDLNAVEKLLSYQPRHLSANGSGMPDEPEDGDDSSSIDGKPRKRFSWIRDTVLVIVTAVIVSILVRLFLVQIFWIPSPSMRETLIENDRIAVSRISAFSNDIKRGDVVVFNDSNGWLPRSKPHGVLGVLRKGAEFIGVVPAGGEQSLVKRVIGIGGDKVACCSSKGLVTVNGKEISEPYIPYKQPPSTVPFHVTVPSDSFWVMGDNRGNSGDSRYHMEASQHPFVKRSDIVGRAVAVIWPIDRWRNLGNRDVFSDVNP